MPTPIHSLQLFLLTAILVLLVSCGGGGDGQVAEGGIGGTGVSQGRVTGYGSVFVNGIEYETDQAEFLVDGRSATQQDIAVGMVVRIDGSTNPDGATGDAYQVTYSSQIIGVIEANRISTDSALDVMGQIVDVDPDTVFDNPLDATPLESLPVNAVAEVSGFTDGGGEILATRIAVRSLAWSGETLRVTGLALNPSDTTFNIGQLLVSLNASLTMPSEGELVTITGSRFSGSAFEAESLDILGQGPSPVADDGESVEIEGRITSALDVLDRLAVDGQWVDASATGYSGSTDRLTEGRIVKVKGEMQDSILIATEIELRYEEDSERGEMGGGIDTRLIDAQGNTLVLLGQTIQVTSSTILESDLEDESSFTLAELNDTDYLQARVYTRDGMLIASKLERRRSPRDYSGEIEGPAEPVDANTIRIFGVPVDVSGVSYTATSGRVEVRGDYLDGVLVASRIEQEEDESDGDGDREDDDD
ncbi:MAG: DUF5666 domain-containing protein [Candidatus Thiodiazotropha sp.]